MLNFLIQEGVQDASQLIEEVTVEKTLSIMDLLISGGIGGQIIIGVLFVLVFS